MIRILLANQPCLLLSGIQTILSTADNIEIIGNAFNSDQLQKQCCQQCFDVLLLLDSFLDFPRCTTINTLLKQCPTVNILTLLYDKNITCPRRLVECGASGGILNTDTSEHLIEAIHATAQGKTWFSMSLMQKFIQPSKERKPLLTEKELAVLQLIVREKANKEIALDMGLSNRTIGGYVTSILSKLDVETRLGAAVWAVREGIFKS